MSVKPVGASLLAKAALLPKETLRLQGRLREQARSDGSKRSVSDRPLAALRRFKLNRKSPGVSARALNGHILVAFRMNLP